jgi:hypothetical protein
MTQTGAAGATLPRVMAGESPPLRLRAEDAEDLAVVSACLQDGLVAVCDLAYDPGTRSFVLIVNRFRWEDSAAGAGAAGPSGGGRFERVLCAVTFENVTAAFYRGFRRFDKDRLLCLLAVGLATDAAPGLAPGLTIDLDFAGDARIRLGVSALRARVHDFGNPWPTSWHPGHELSVLS